MNLQWTGLVLSGAALFATIVGTRAFEAYAISRGILANPNFRSLHQRPVPCAGGIVFSSVFVCSVAALWVAGGVEDDLALAIVAGGMAATIFGFIDDRTQIPWKVKLGVQAALAAWIIVTFRGVPLVDLPLTPLLVDLALSWLALVWLMNVYNFMDGIDGMAASGAVFMSVGAIVALLLTNAALGLVLAFTLLAICSGGFLLSNWPPARIFMGDAGSLTLGYCFGALLTVTVTGGDVSIWTWLILFGYFAGDTTTTTVFRIFITRHWYGEHRSHAYQNLARIWNSHLLVVRRVCFYHVFWLLPLVVWSVVIPHHAPLAAVLALGPVVAWAVLYGPRLSST